MRNIELKAELRDLALARSICSAIGATHIIDLEQTDIYFRLPSGRLKRRESPGEPTEYIFYDRQDRAAPRMSNFTIYSEAAAQERFGATPLPELVTVKKKRQVYMIGNVRIHLDQVQGLGKFIEFEALVSQSQSVQKCHAAIQKLREQLSPVLGEQIATSYSDLVLNLQAHTD